MRRRRTSVLLLTLVGRSPLSTDAKLGEQLRDGETKCRSQFLDIPQRDVAGPTLNVADIRPVNASAVCKLFLRQTHFEPSTSDRTSECGANVRLALRA